MSSVYQRLGRFLLTLGCFLFFISNTGAQTPNSWTNSASGNWEDLRWSLGALPTTNQDVLITNAGWKAVQIGWTTANTYPQTLTVNSITISSPTNSSNTLLLNYAGTATPLTVRSISLGSNSAITLLASALNLNGPTGVGMSIGGTFNHDDNSGVTGNQLDLGYIGAGVYNLNSGSLDVGHVWIGSSFAGVFNQSGGSNLTGITH